MLSAPTAYDRIFLERMDNMINKPIEILAPGGSLACLKSAIDSGADAVYFGGSRFGARTNAVNLSNDEIIEAVEYAHLRFARLYVTVNTLVSDAELSDVYDFINFCYTAGVDGVIVQDLGVFNIIKTHFPDLRVHASTQMTIHNLAGAQTAYELGFDRVVLSRELSLEEIKHISANCPIELEVFVHGALCMSYSGQCLFSSFLGGRSGNRGSCAQPCRLPYTLLDADGNQVSEKEKYLLSLKDLCLAEHIEDLKNAGVTSFKIEGRMKSEAYVSGVCGIYNKYRNGGKISADDKRLLENIFSRGGFTQGYYNGAYGRDMLSYSSNHDNIFSSATDDVLDEAKSFAKSGFSIKVSAEFSARLGERAEFTVYYNSQKFTSVSENITESAQSTPATEERIRQQLSKLGGTVFEYSSLDVFADDGIYISVKDINSLRRDAFDKLKSHILLSHRQAKKDKLVIIKPGKKNTPAHISCSVLSFEQALKAYDMGFERIYVPFGVYSSRSSYFDSNPDVFVVKLPPVIHDTRPIDTSLIKTDAVCITNIGQLSVIDKDKKIYADYRLNIFNTLCSKQLMTMGIDSVCLSPELTISELKDIGSHIPTEILVYGRVSMMTVRNCLIRSSKNKCLCKPGEIYYLKDRKNICFPVLPDNTSCTNVIYNSAPIVMSDRLKEIETIGADFYRYDFTVETPDEIEKIVTMYEKGKKPEGFFTRGHFYNGVL